MKACFFRVFFIFLLICTSNRLSLYAETTPFVSEILSIGIFVDDLQNAQKFYTEVLCFEKQAEEDVQEDSYKSLIGGEQTSLRIAKLKLGDQKLELIQKDLSSHLNQQFQPFVYTAIVTKSLEEAQKHLEKKQTEGLVFSIEKIKDCLGPSPRCNALLISDPWGNFFKVILSPYENEKWKTPNEALFWGIDHVALITKNTEKSLQLYHKTLGMTISAVKNTEEDQDKSKITTLRVEKGIDIKLIEKENDKSDPAPSTAFAFWQIKFLPRDFVSLWIMLQEKGYRLQRTTKVTLSSSKPRARTGILFKDPDHYVLFIEDPSEVHL